MKKIKEEGFIKEFVDTIKKEYPSLMIDYYYDDEDEYFAIWHNNPKLQFENDNFLEYVGGLMKEKLVSNGVKDFSFAYDYYKAKEYEDNRFKSFLNNIEAVFKNYNINKNSFEIHVDVKNSIKNSGKHYYNINNMKYKHLTDAIFNTKIFETIQEKLAKKQALEKIEINKKDSSWELKPYKPIKTIGKAIDFEIFEKPELNTKGLAA